MKKRSKSLRMRLDGEIRRIKIYSSHEHYCPEEEYLAGRLDFTSLFGYLGYALVSSGMSREVLRQLRDSSTPEDEKWNLFEPFRERVSNLEYFREIRIVLRDRFEINDLTRATYRQAGESLRRVQQPGRYRQVLDASGIEYALVDNCQFLRLPSLPSYDPALFGQVWRDFWINPQFYRQNGVETVADGLALIDRTIGYLAGHNTRAIKIASAASGCCPLSFKKWDDAQVRTAFTLLMADTPVASIEATLPFKDTAVYRAVEAATQRGMMVQIHTGMQSYAAGNPYFLKNLIDAFPDTPFDLFHAGYPYSGELAVLAQWFPNVYGDLCWMANVSQALTRRILGEWLDMVPAHKILGFGSDHGFIENTYGYQVSAREIICDAMEEKVLSGRLEEDQAVVLARRLLRDNLRELLESLSANGPARIE